MSELRDLVGTQSPRRTRLPEFVGRALRAGIVSSDPDISRRQIFANVAAYGVLLSAVSHFVMGIGHDFVGLLPLHIYNAIVIVIALSVHRLHRYGENLVAMAVSTLIVGGHSFVVFALGYDSDLQDYFLLVPLLFFLFGVNHWRSFAVFYAAAFVMLLATVELGRPMGFLVPGDTAFRDFLQVQALANTMIINGLGVAYVITLLSRAERDLARQMAISDALVDVMLPRHVSERLRGAEGRHLADRIDNATVMFADLAGFTPAAASVSASDLVSYLDRLFSAFDELCRQHGVDKIKTVGDAYMVAALSGDPREKAVAVGSLAFALIRTVRDHGNLGDVPMSIRIGIHSGSLVAGVIGDLRVSYDVWGDTVNTAQRMEAHGMPNRIQVTAAFRELAGDVFAYEERELIKIKGLGEARTFLLASGAPA